MSACTARGCCAAAPKGVSGLGLIIVPALYGAILWLDHRLCAGAEPAGRAARTLYRVLVVLALVFALPTSFALRLDHVGASLSGLVSMFAR